MNLQRFLLIFWSACLACAVGNAPLAQVSPELAAGASIYREGHLASGQPLTAYRKDGEKISGEQVACVNCHRRSGLGGKESRILIPPIAGPYLFHARAGENQDNDLAYVEGIRANRDPYTDLSLARAIREGVGADGRKFGYLMPHYDLPDADMKSLLAYLKNLGSASVPGVGETTLHFATIVTPDADPIKREAMLSVIKEYFKDKNTFYRGENPRLRSTRKMMFKVSRLWELYVWELQGAPETWERQLHDHMRATPVFAVISGIAGKNWEPVQQFCDHEAAPCLFPNVELPSASADKGYSVFFSQGVLLESSLIAKDLASRVPDLGKHRLIQVYRSGDVGEAAAQSLAELAKIVGITSVPQALPEKPDPGDVTKAMGEAKEGDVLVLWLRPKDVADLGDLPKTERIYASALMAGADHPPFPETWRSRIRLAYPFDVPARRRVPVDYALGWFTIRHIPILDLQIQADTFLACGILAETLGHMVDAFVRDYLIERMEDMLGRRLITGYYRHLSLGSGQRFASKGGYIVRYNTEQPAKLVADGEWIVP